MRVDVIHHWRIFRSSYRELALVAFEPTPTKFRSDTLTNWVIRSCIQLALKANYVKLLQFHLFVQCLRFISNIAFVSHHIWFKPNLTQLIKLVAEWVDIYGIHHWRIFRSSNRKLTCVWFEPLTTKFCSDALTDWVITPCIYLFVCLITIELKLLMGVCADTDTVTVTTVLRLPLWSLWTATNMGCLTFLLAFKYWLKLYYLFQVANGWLVLTATFWTAWVSTRQKIWIPSIFINVATKR